MVTRANQLAKVVIVHRTKTLAEVVARANQKASVEWWWRMKETLLRKRCGVQHNPPRRIKSSARPRFKQTCWGKGGVLETRQACAVQQHKTRVKSSRRPRFKKTCWGGVLATGSKRGRSSRANQNRKLMVVPQIGSEKLRKYKSDIYRTHT